MIKSSQLFTNADGSIYHLNLHPEDIADHIILVGDRDRVAMISRHFDHIDTKKSKREFVTHTGEYQGVRCTALSTGIGVGNIDIVMNELDALCNIDLKTKTLHPTLRALNIIRFGTCGTSSPDIDIDSISISHHAIGFDGALNFYQRTLSEIDSQFQSTVLKQLAGLPCYDAIYTASADPLFSNYFSPLGTCGITLTCSGFYGPQQRQLRIPLRDNQLIHKANQIEFQGRKVINLEMETAMIFGLGQLLGHHCGSINTIIANRITETVSKNPKKSIEKMIETGLQKLIEYAKNNE